MEPEETDPYDVVIVGYGPTGMVLAALLGQDGRRVAVLERHAGLYGRPRAAVFDDETMRLFQKLGIADEIAAGALAYPRYEWLNGAGEVLLELTYDDPGPSGWPEMHMMYQPHVEDALDGLCRRLPSVTVLRGTPAERIEARDDGVVVHAGGVPAAVRGRYLVAADGGTSFVRRALGIPEDDYGFEENWLVCDFEETGGLDVPYFRQLCDPVQPTAIVRIGPDHHRFSFMLDRDEPAERATDPARVWERVRRWGGPEDMTMVRVANYTFRSRVAARWREGRVLLAGDAAHQMPPFLGQGMCSGLRDAHNLAFKLGLILDGRAGDALLDTYQAEREPHVRAIIEKGVELGRVQTLRDPEAAKARDAELLRKRAESVAPERLRFPAYGEGLLSAADGSRARGNLMVQGRVRTADGAVARFDDRFGAGWLLIADDPGLVAGLDVSCRAVALSDDFEDVDGVYRGWFAEHDCHAALVRPDWHVFGAASDRTAVGALTAELEACLQ